MASSATFNLHPGKKIFFALLLLLGVLFYLFKSHSDNKKLLAALTHVSLPYLLLLIVGVAVYLFCQASFLKTMYQAVSLKRSILYCLNMVLSTNFVNTVTPVAGLSGPAYLIFIEEQQNTPRTHTLLLNALFYLVDYGIFLLILVLAIIYIYFSHQLAPFILHAAITITIIVAGLASLAIFLLSHTEALPQLLEWLNARAAFFRPSKKKPLSTTKIRTFSRHAQGIWQEATAKPRILWKGAVQASFIHGTSLLLFWLSCVSIGFHPSIQILVVGYTIATLLSVVSITPAGIGIAEGGMTATFTSLGLHFETALLISLIYRCAIVLLPLLGGLPAIHFFTRLSSQDKPASGILTT